MIEQLYANGLRVDALAEGCLTFLHIALKISAWSPKTWSQALQRGGLAHSQLSFLWVAISERRPRSCSLDVNACLKQ